MPVPYHEINSVCLSVFRALLVDFSVLCYGVDWVGNRIEAHFAGIYASSGTEERRGRVVRHSVVSFRQLEKLDIIARRSQAIKYVFVLRGGGVRGAKIIYLPGAQINDPLISMSQAKTPSRTNIDTKYQEHVLQTLIMCAYQKHAWYPCSEKWGYKPPMPPPPLFGPHDL